ncbi:MAG: metal-sensing transcriptional repressor [Clostridia bacterium]|nr:metal-sensing transcriptional repressor [Clostridia bacterium]
MEEEKKECPHCRKKVRTEDDKKALINRLSRIEGQIRGIKGMVEKDAYCPDILIQSAAVTSAINSFSKELLAAHIKSCVAEDIGSGDEERSAAAIDELTALLLKLMK